MKGATFNMECPKCGSSEVVIQREQTASIGGSIHSFGSKGHGIIWWLCIGWWIWIFKWLWEFIKIACTGGLSLLFRRKKGMRGKTVSASKTLNRTVAVCQSCGNHWKV